MNRYERDFCNLHASRWNQTYVLRMCGQNRIKCQIEMREHKLTFSKILEFNMCLTKSVLASVNVVPSPLSVAPGPMTTIILQSHIAECKQIFKL